MTTLGSPTLLLDEGLIAALRTDLAAAGWTASHVESLLSPMALAAMKRDQFTPAAMELETNASPAAVLTRLFMLAEPVEAEAVKRALPTLGIAGARKLGLLEQGESGSTTTSSLIDLRPHQAESSDGEGAAHHWWVASDLSQAQSGQPPREDYVLGIAAASLNLARLALRDPVDAALDLGCGCGILSLYLANHAERVVATDISERACHYTRFNALLNGVEIDVRQGSFFEPVASERFDLIVSNPPFVITPQAIRAGVTFEYRDGGMERDHVIPLVIRGAISHLSPGGTLQILANWEVRGTEETWAESPRRWIEQAAEVALAEGLPVDAWLVQRDLLDISQYAEWWIRDARGTHVAPDQWRAEYREWLRDFTAAGTRWVGLGSLALRVGKIAARSTTGNSSGEARSSSVRDTPGTRDDVVENSSSHGLTVICEYLPEGKPADAAAVKTALDSLILPQDWESIAFVCAPDVREVRYFVPGSSDPELIRITQGRAGGRERSVPSAVAALIGVSDGEITPAQVIPAIAMLLDQSEEQVRAEIESALPELLRSGVLLH